MSFLFSPTCDYDELFQFPFFVSLFIKANGLWPTDGDSNDLWFRIRNKLYILWGWIVIGCTAFVVGAELSYFVSNAEDLTKAVESLCTSIIGLMMVVRSIHLRYATSQLKKLMWIFAKAIWIKRNSHPRIFDRCLRRTRPIAYLSFSLTAVLFIYASLPIVGLFTGEHTMESTDKGLPYSMVYPYDYQPYWRYIFTFCLSMYAGFVTVTQFYALDALFAYFIIFLSGQFEILHKNILHLIPQCHAEWLKGHRVEIVHRNDSIRHLEAMYCRRLEEIVRRHNVLIRFCTELNKFSSFPLVVNFLTSTFLICFVGFQFLIGGSNSLSDFSRFFLYFLTVTGQLYLICKIGSLLISQSRNTAYYLYMCNWEGGYISMNSPLLFQPEDMDVAELDYKIPLWQHIDYYPTNRSFQHKLRFMIMRSHRPVQLTAMHYMVLSLETCSRIVSSSLSFFTVLRTFLEKQT